MKAKRIEAILNGLTKYCGTLCKKCGTTTKYTKTDACVVCAIKLATKRAACIKC